MQDHEQVENAMVRLPAKTLNIIGCGKLGKTLARLWHEHGSFEMQDVLNSSLASGQDAVSFIGAGQAVARYEDFRPADVWLIATGDDAIAASCEMLAASGKLTDAAVVFHCSGALSSEVLRAASKLGAAVASIHPVCSFASPEKTLLQFAGTWCGVEGCDAALETLEGAFIAISAKLVSVQASQKTLYHAAAVFACNYLVTLLDTAVHSYAKAGVPEDVALKLMEPLVRGTVDNVFRMGPAAALSGPIARGDMATARGQQQAVTAWNADYGDLYESFIKLTVELAARRP